MALRFAASMPPLHRGAGLFEGSPGETTGRELRADGPESVAGDPDGLDEAPHRRRAGGVEHPVAAPAGGEIGLHGPSAPFVRVGWIGDVGRGHAGQALGRPQV